MQDFASKRSALFACLDDASKELKGTVLDQGDKPICALKRNRFCISTEKSLSFLRGKESIFKKPERPITKCLKARQTPDYQMNPHKWKKYSLSDVDISDHTNTTAAFAFLREMDEQRDAGYESQSMDAADQSPDRVNKVEFKRSSKISRNLRELEEKDEVADAEVDRPKLKGSKLVMPEYVVGQKKVAAGIKKKMNKKPNKINSEGRSRAAGSLKLSHLLELDVEADNGDDEVVGER